MQMTASKYIRPLLRRPPRLLRRRLLRLRRLLRRRRLLARLRLLLLCRLLRLLAEKKRISFQSSWFETIVFAVKLAVSGSIIRGVGVYI